MGAVPLGSSMVASMASLHPKQKPTLAPRHVPRPSGAQSDSIFPRAGWGVSFFLVGGKETYSGEWKFHSKVDGLIFCWFGEWLLQKTPLLVGELDFVYQLVSFRRSEMRCWDCWDVFVWTYWFWEFDMQPQNFSRYPSIYIILENDNTDHVPTCFPPQLHIDSLLWRSRGKYMLPQRYLIAAVPEKYSSAMSLSLCNILYKVGAWWYIYIYIHTYLGYSLPRGYLLYEKRCPFDKVMQVAELAEFSKFYILLPRNSLKYIWWNWKTTIKSSSLPGYTS